MPEETYKPSEVLERLPGVAASTLRAWTLQFEEFFDEGVRNRPRTPGGGRTHRRYSEEDIETLNRIKAMRQSNLSNERIRERLRIVDGADEGFSEIVEGNLPAPRDEVLAPAFLETVQEALQLVVDQRSTIQDLQRRMSNREEQVEELRQEMKERDAEIQHLQRRLLVLEKDLRQTKQTDEPEPDRWSFIDWFLGR